jgi:hypothetical protein
VLRVTYILFLIVIFPALAFAIEGVDCSIAEVAIKTASRLRELPIKKSVSCKLQDKEQVRRYLIDAVTTKMPPERIKREGQVYKMLGFIPEDFDYLKGIIEMYTAQLGGYYDPEAEYYAMASWMPMAMQMPIAIHELTHALQDQHYELDKLIDPGSATSDELMARTALIEGDATAVMLDYTRSLVGQGPISREETTSSFILQNLSGAMLSSSLSKSPAALQAMMLFPYLSGLNFSHAILKSSGYEGIHRAFSRLPRSTEEILHPEKYFAQQRSFQILEDPKPPKGVKLESDTAVFTDTIGEFAVSTLLRAWLSPQQAADAASGWGGDKLVLYQIDDSSKVILLWHTAWDDQKEAQEFFDGFVQAYSVRFSKTPIKTSTKVSFVVERLGPVEIQIQGLDVYLRMGS